MMRFRRLLLVVAWLAVVPAQGADLSVRVVRRADIYAQPTGSASVVAVAQDGQRLEVLARQGDWYQVRIPSTTQVGHIYAPFVEPTTTYPPAPPVAVAGQGMVPASVPIAAVQAAPNAYVQTSPMLVVAQPVFVTPVGGQPASTSGAMVMMVPVGTTPLTTMVAPAPSVLPFSMGSPIPLGPVTDGPVALHTARFRMDKGLLLAELYATCDEGEDQDVSVTVQLLDELGVPVAALNVNGGVEEEDDATLKTKAHVPAAQLARVRAFALRASTRPD
jgi:hypothetical protein